MEKKIIHNSITILAEPSRVWSILTRPEETKKYMFGCETVSDWKKGSPLLWKGEYEGKEMIFVKGTILQIEKDKLLKYSVIDPFASYPDIPENHLHVTYELNLEKDHTRLTVTMDGFESAADGEKRFQESYNNGEGWNPILIAIKEIAEST